eukprot:TRINITY_DN4265_c0_g2_i3.p1 TRINITY_DN4265_c0_g2~~TRINITY_DN4265_c0_g2_i3.p1  ORF type:complete len:196 (+),score=18.23 TRINITY_DN4265_c0_g2_i3:43-630(+)
MRSIFTMQNAARPFCSFALSFLKGVSASAVSISHTRGRNLSFVGVRMYSIPQEVKRRKTRLLLQQVIISNVIRRIFFNLHKQHMKRTIVKLFLYVIDINTLSKLFLYHHTSSRHFNISISESVFVHFFVHFSVHFSVHFLFIFCSFSVHFLFIFCSFSVHFLFIFCSFFFWTPQKWAQMEKVGEASQSTQQTTTS